MDPHRHLSPESVIGSSAPGDLLTFKAPAMVRMDRYADSVSRILRDTYKHFQCRALGGNLSTRLMPASSTVARVPSRVRVSAAVHLTVGGAHGPPEADIRIPGREHIPPT